jgi:hypothetical protein
LVSKRFLTDPREWDIFRYHYLLGADSKLCCDRLNMTKADFFHAAYRIEETLGEVLMSLRPFALYPIDDYFAAVSRRVDVRPLAIPDERHRNGVPLRPPIRVLPVVCKPERVAVPVALPVPVPAAVSTQAPEPVDASAHARAAFRRGCTLKTIAASLARLNAAPNGERWMPSDVRLLLRTDNATHPRLRKAA